MSDLDREPTAGDAFGAALLDAAAGGPGVFILERDDGFVDAMEASVFFAGPDQWPEPADRLFRLVAGRILDVGAGAGRVSLALQDQGYDVTALDISEPAIDICRSRGVRRTFLGSLEELEATGAPRFDTILLLGHNLGLLESRRHAGVLFDRLRGLLAADGALIGSALNPYLTDDPTHLTYHQRNRERGRYPGQVRLRIRRRDIAGTWFDYLYLAPDELRDLASASRWRLDEVIDLDPSYLALLRPL